MAGTRARHPQNSITEKSLSRLYESLGESIRMASPVESLSPADDDSPRLHLLGHSFGGRMTIRALE
ncbi:MAG TPA: hypothetical protein VJ984_09335 [Xanthomonadales bacterium]|nr:hypothetical protein [Xanthomonadales bacterium]